MTQWLLSPIVTMGSKKAWQRVVEKERGLRIL